jgi:uncharacterized membrane protein
MDVTGLIQLVIALLILGLLFYVIVWLIDWVGVGEPFNKVIKAFVGIIFILYLLGILAGGVPPPTHYFWRR